ncbi:FAD-dependent monooxygenase [Streptomyces sp. NBC_01298]|uniref:FAD-dependent oxidoreductase n=1 Tax=Streptomyces sp. NBC_01298 TaxID=2903817 RepID=UPI002E109941|nr:FAD-dependent monooxygenase [Streptomyces sp. NBC_01298]
MSKMDDVLVLGGGFAGMAAAAALAPHARTITIIERDELPAGPEARRGLPQAAHAHMFWSGGADAIEALLPGTQNAWMDAGANRVPIPTGMVSLSPGGWYRLWPESHYLIAASRDLIDWGVRGRLGTLPNVQIMWGTEPIALLGDASRIRGARVRGRDGAEREVKAKLVIDATGRTSRGPHWLSALGVQHIPVETVDAGVTYATARIKAPTPTAHWPVINIQADPRLGRPGKVATILPIEHDEWIVSLSGTRGASPTNRAEDFETYARNTRSPLVADLLAAAGPIDSVVVTRTTANRRYRYEKARRLPDGFLAIGDAATALNPVYGHGLSVAALSALALQRVAERRGIAERGFTKLARRAMARPAAGAWMLATAQDARFPGAEGKRVTVADNVANWYVNRLIYTATGDITVTTALTDLMTLKKGPLALANPRVLLAALCGPQMRSLPGPPLPPATAALLLVT